MCSSKRKLTKYATFLIVAGLTGMVSIPSPVRADDWGISLDLPFFRVRAYDGYYYYDNDYMRPYWYQSYHYAPEGRYYYYPYRHRQYPPHKHWMGPDGNHRYYED
jgi:hypothetical protein